MAKDSGSKKKRPLNAKQARFVEEYLKDPNATQAAIRAGYHTKAESWGGFYVYLLVDPRTHDIFYVGKGSGRRAHMHSAMVRRGRTDNGAKCARIAKILAEGLNVQVLVLEDGLTETEAFTLEREIISALRRKGLTNIAGGVVTATEARMNRAAALRDTMLSYDEWVATAPASKLESVARVFGSTEAFYSWYTAKLDELATNPQPLEVKSRAA